MLVLSFEEGVDVIDSDDGDVEDWAGERKNQA